MPNALICPWAATMSWYIRVECERYLGSGCPFTVWLKPSITRNKAKNTGIGSSIGRHDPNGLTPCSRNRAIWASANACLSSLCCCCSRFSWG